MAAPTDNDDLQQLLHQIEESTRDHDTVELGTLLDAVGRRSYGPLLMLTGLIAVSPLSGIPGVPSVIGVIVTVISAQLLIRRKHFWFPGWATRRSIARSKLDRALRWLRAPARVVDRIVRPRLVWLTHGVATYAIAALCLVIAVTMPPLEILPFTASAAGAALATFGLALVGRDGVMALIATAFTSVIIWLVATQLF